MNFLFFGDFELFEYFLVLILIGRIFIRLEGSIRGVGRL